MAENFYPRSPCGERRAKIMLPCFSSSFLSTLSLRRATANRHRPGAYKAISIHALLAESDAGRLPSRRGIAISIHALLAESDPTYTKARGWKTHFYPRSPCGERPVKCFKLRRLNVFLSTLSLRRATGNINGGVKLEGISIHALLAESDAEMVSRSSISCQFLSTLSLRRATTSLVVIGTNCVISIHALLAESDPRWESLRWK